MKSLSGKSLFDKIEPVFHRIINMRRCSSFMAGALAVLLGLGGCVSIDESTMAPFEEITIQGSPNKAVEHIVVSNFGYYLFDIFPIICGNTSENAILPFKLFSDEVTLDCVQNVLIKQARSRGCDLANLSTYHRNDPCFSLSLDPKSVIMLLFCYREVQQSAVLMKKSFAEEEMSP